MSEISYFRIWLACTTQFPVHNQLLNVRSKRALEEALEASEMDQLDENILAQALRSSRQAFEANFSEDDALFEQAVKASKAYLKQQEEEALKEILK